MQNSKFNLGSKIKVIDRSSEFFRFRGTIKEMPSVESIDDVCTCHLTKDIAAHCVDLFVTLKFHQIDTIQKKFIDIEHIKEESTDLGNGIIRRANIGAFEVGDYIQVSEKCDGANASIAYNEDEGKLEIFSRTNILNGADGLRGFKAFIETKFKPDEFSKFPDLVIFGEWCVSHKVQYSKEWYNTWKVYDIWSKTKKNYMPQSFVKQFCIDHGLEYIHALYEGPFVSWDHCRTFMHANSYGDSQEGIVVKNQSKLDCDDIRFPKYLKIVNEAFKESMAKKEKKPVDPKQLKEEQEAYATMATVVTEARVHKLILKLVDEGTLEKDLKPKDMAIVCKSLPKMVWDDLMKEESEVLQRVGALAGKISNKLVIEHCKKIIIGK